MDRLCFSKVYPLFAINLLGRYEFSMDPSVEDGDLRPLRDPNALLGLEMESRDICETLTRFSKFTLR